MNFARTLAQQFTQTSTQLSLNFGSASLRGLEAVLSSGDGHEQLWHLQVYFST